MDWDARPSIPPRRQGRRSRAFDFAQWYPRVVVYDQYGWEEHPMYPAGEFYGEFGTFLVRLDVAEDQDIGATGVPVCGDPGWARATRQPGRPIDYQRDFYGDPSRFGCRSAAAAVGRKVVTWYAADVHHFAMSLNPDYRYEAGRWGGVAVHVLYQPGDEKSWGGGVAVQRRLDVMIEGARLARPDVWHVSLAADHQRPPDRGGRHRVPHDDHGRLGLRGADRP